MKSEQEQVVTVGCGLQAGGIAAIYEQHRKQLAAIASSVADALYAVANTKDPLVRINEAHRHALLTAFAAAPDRIDPVYANDDYPRENCKIVVELRQDKYLMSVYAPGFVPHGPLGKIEAFGPRPLASVGLAVKRFASGSPVQPVTGPLGEAEEIQESVSRPAVIE